MSQIELIPIEEAAQVLECTPERVVQLLKHGELPGVKIGRPWIIPRAAFFQRLNEKALEEAADRRQRRAAPAAAPAPAVAQPSVPKYLPRVGRRRPLLDLSGGA